MKDIDFDELDRAVSSVLSQKKPSSDDVAPASYDDENKQDTVSVTTSTTTNAADDSAQAVTTDQPVKTEEASATPETPVADTPEKPEDVETTPAPTPTASPLAVKRRGKFMDVMHPSHDMAPGATTAALPASRPKHLLEPVSHDVKPEEDNSPSPEPAESEKPAATAEPIASKSETQPEDTPSEELDKKPNSLYIDPLELDDKSKDATPEASADTAEDITTETAPDMLQATPFLSDAKVEKRPLGGFSEPETAPSAAEQAPSTDTPAEQPADSQVSPSVPLPRELQPDVVKVEAVHDDTQPPTDGVTKQNSSVEPASTGKPAETNEKTQSHPLFDTSTYHEPTAAKHGGKKSGWVMWVVGFIVCLVIGGGVGYFLFTVGF